MDKHNPNRNISPSTEASDDTFPKGDKASQQRATHFRESYFIEDEDEEYTLTSQTPKGDTTPKESILREGPTHSTAQPSEEEAISPEENSHDHTEDPVQNRGIGEGTPQADKQEHESSSPKSAQQQPSATPQQERKSSQHSVASYIGQLLGKSLMGFKGDHFVAILTGPYRLVFVTIVISLIFNIALHYVLAGQLKEVERLQTEMDDYTKRQQFISSELTHALTQDDILERLRQQGIPLAPADSAPYIIYVPIPEDLRDE